MSDSIDRVFVKAISTIRTLSTRSSHSSLPRPPLANRVKLYGLYKQATEGDVSGIVDRPTGIKPEDEAAKRKWDAWKMEEGLSKTEAKRGYISYLIETMKSHANDSIEARELLGDLEYLWDQVKDQSPTITDNQHGMHDIGSVGGSSLMGRAESPALSLYRLASSGSNTNIIRPVSRLSMTNMHQYGQGGAGGLQISNMNNGGGLHVDKQRTISSNTAVSNSGGVSAGSSTSNVSGITSGNTNGVGAVPKSMEFIKWQNDINSTLSRLTYEISNLRSIGYQQHLQQGVTSNTSISAQSGINNPSSSNSKRRGQSHSKNTTGIVTKTLISIKSLISSLISNIYKMVRTFVKHAAVDSIVLIVCITILRNLNIVKTPIIANPDGSNTVSKLMQTGEYVVSFLRRLYVIVVSNGGLMAQNKISQATKPVTAPVLSTMIT
ncbi:hypothetical protein CANARDRAFT_24184 [[Candida] arabinofermentans NRRL YB-2248]|uniref:ACB domain-containing protein n=1 Tax=[Candida] arabinofermentans NRRL YB-2248 TaxID=983967 RepID=A0A1E4SY34_9ASCO|nr:hypothetical protein CANARDRAFT_24184 [[Candida] arabinofermentans NRRL YB-2248]